MSLGTYPAIQPSPHLAAGRPLYPNGSRKPVLLLSGIRKSYGSVAALKGVDLSIFPGEVHAIVGENGAGKSTLIGIAAGVVRADAGTITIAGQMVADPDPIQMRTRGISVAFQHPALIPDLTVLENLQLVAPDLQGSAGVAAAIALMRRVASPALQVPPGRRIADLTLAQKHAVEIARAIATKPNVLILDEPTEPFQAIDAQGLFALVESLKREGTAIVYISHRLHEVMEIADHVSVLRDGELVDSQRRCNVTPAAIVTQIVGRPLGQVFPEKAGRVGAEPILQAIGLSGPGFNDVSLAVATGEIVGVTGVEGQGQREFIRALAGLNAWQNGQVLVQSKAVQGTGRSAAMQAGIGFVTDDRHAEGLLMPMTVRENLGIRLLDRLAKGGVVSSEDEVRASNTIVESLKIKTASLETPVAALSGGNQQKVLFGREIAAAPKVLLVDEPTKGVDIGSRSEIYHQLRDLADAGTPIVVSSSDGVELQGLCDRVLVFSMGAVAQELDGARVTDDNITEANLGATRWRDASAQDPTRPGRLKPLLAHDYFPPLILGLVSATILFGTSLVTPTLLSAQSMSQAATFLSALTLISLAQLCTVLTGSIDLSVGPLAGLAVVLASFLVPADAPWGLLLAGAFGVVAICTLVGLAQGMVIETLRLPSMVVTLATFIGFQGISLMLRPQPAGIIADELSDTLTATVGGVPAIAIAMLIVVGLLEWAVVRSRLGRSARALGSDPGASFRLGIDRWRVGVSAFVISGFLCGLGGLILAGQVGVGSALTGLDYTLMSITAVVLGGASIAGGRGSFLVTLLGAVLVQSTVTMTSFLNISTEWQYWILGLITLCAAGLFSYVRQARA